VGGERERGERGWKERKKRELERELENIATLDK